MKKHNFKESMDIFAKMFEGWSVVGKSGTYPLTSANPFNGLMFSYNVVFQEKEVSHIEQTKPINGDEVWAWDDHESCKRKAIYVGKITNGIHVVEIEKAIWKYVNIQLIPPTLKFTIQEAAEMLKGIVTEPFEITKE